MSPSGGTPPIVALVPAAGRAERLGRQLPCSKEIFPLGLRPVCEPLLEAFRAAAIRRAYVLLRKGKWDIPELLGRGIAPGTAEGLHLAYLALDPTASVPETLDAAFPFVEGCRVALGFPDILFEPRDAYRHLLERQASSGADVVLGLFPTDQPEKTDMVELDAGGRVRRLVIKQPDAGLAYTWSIAVWGPAFTALLHARVDERRGTNEELLHCPPPGELWVGDVIQGAVDDGLAVEAVCFPDGSYLDVGTPEDLRRAISRELQSGEVR